MQFLLGIHGSQAVHEQVKDDRMQTGLADCGCVCMQVWADAHQTGGPCRVLLGYGHRLDSTCCKMTLNNPLTHVHTCTNTWGQQLPTQCLLSPVELIVKSPNVSHFPATIKSVISLFIREDWGGGWRTGEKLERV